jgi:hypothetical protein
LASSSFTSRKSNSEALLRISALRISNLRRKKMI